MYSCDTLFQNGAVDTTCLQQLASAYNAVTDITAAKKKAKEESKKAFDTWSAIYQDEQTLRLVDKKILELKAEMYLLQAITGVDADGSSADETAIQAAKKTRAEGYKKLTKMIDLKSEGEAEMAQLARVLQQQLDVSGEHWPSFIVIYRDDAGEETGCAMGAKEAIESASASEKDLVITDADAVRAFSLECFHTSRGARKAFAHAKANEQAEALKTQLSAIKGVDGVVTGRENINLEHVTIPAPAQATAAPVQATATYAQATATEATAAPGTYVFKMDVVINGLPVRFDVLLVGVGGGAYALGPAKYCVTHSRSSREAYGFSHTEDASASHVSGNVETGLHLTSVAGLAGAFAKNRFVDIREMYPCTPARLVKLLLAPAVKQVDLKPGTYDEAELRERAAGAALAWTSMSLLKILPVEPIVPAGVNTVAGFELVLAPDGFASISLPLYVVRFARKVISKRSPSAMASDPSIELVLRIMRGALEVALTLDKISSLCPCEPRSLASFKTISGHVYRECYKRHYTTLKLVEAFFQTTNLEVVANFSPKIFVSMVRSVIAQINNMARADASGVEALTWTIYVHPGYVNAARRAFANVLQALGKQTTTVFREHEAKAASASAPMDVDMGVAVAAEAMDKTVASV